MANRDLIEADGSAAKARLSFPNKCAGDKITGRSWLLGQKTYSPMSRRWASCPVLVDENLRSIGGPECEGPAPFLP